MLRLCGSVISVLCIYSVLGSIDESMFTDEMKTMMTTVHKKCVEQTSVDEGIIDQAISGDIQEDEKLKCYMKCTLTESGVLSDSGDFDFGPVEQIAPEEMREAHKKVFDTCTPQAGNVDDLCEKAFTVMKCAHDEDPENFYMF
ncbi:general odorant-binding protein 83a-like [Cylas formicarius]|uniref:Odorant binding protein n=2 Tax=Neoptera TaxID=33340 RepID=A0A6B7MBM4_CYLFO|nr:general odorant-binding protein 83a-like [Cylas formicarius]QFO46782.1 odorant binding protein [Cylas formicarius]